jgi:putative N6-adenine-specific DNA methylase
MPRPTPSSPPSRRGRPDRLAAVVVCLPGHEPLVAEELDGLGIRSRPAGTGAVAARLTTRQLYDANVRLAAATRILVDAGELTARSFPALEERIGAVDLDPFLDRRRPVRLRTSSHRSKLHHTGAVEERLRRLLALGPAPAAEVEDAQLVVVRIDRDRINVRVDSSGAPLHHRGWRGPAGKAPLRETLAAAALAAIGWQPHQPLVDPFAGSGTIPIEAARWAAGIAPGAHRRFGFERWPSFAPGTWASVRAGVATADVSPADLSPADVSDGDVWPADAAATAGADAGPADGSPAADTDAAPIVARDRDAGAVAAMLENAARAGVARRVDVARGAVSDLVPPDATAGPGWIVTNPPWGGRLRGGSGDVRDLYARLGQVVQERFPGWGVALLVPDVRLAHAAGVRGEPVWRSRAGPNPVHLVARPPAEA